MPIEKICDESAKLIAAGGSYSTNKLFAGRCSGCGAEIPTDPSQCHRLELTTSLDNGIMSQFKEHTDVETFCKQCWEERDNKLNHYLPPEVPEGMKIEWKKPM